jgi:hypothetical protein
MKRKWHSAYGHLIFSIHFLGMLFLLNACQPERGKGLEILNRLEQKEIAQRQFNFEKDSGFYNELYQYLYESNRTFIEYLDSLEYISQKTNRHTGVTYLVGETGVGKSLFSRIIKSRFGIRFLRLPMHQLAREKYSDYFDRKAELTDMAGDTTLSWLLDVKIKRQINFTDFLRIAEFREFLSSDKIFLVVDELDELHPDSRQLILSLIDEFAQINNTLRTFRFIHVFVLGKQELFHEYLKGRKLNGQRFEIYPPIYTSGHDLNVLKMDYETYFDQNIPATAIEDVKVLFRANPFLIPTMNNLFRSNFMISEAGVLKDWDEVSIKNVLFERTLERIQDTHQRPGPGNELYVRALQQVAIKYINKIDDQGNFEVSKTDTVRFRMDEKYWAFNVLELISNSGLIRIDLSNTEQNRMRFQPIWLHRYLVENEWSEMSI